MRRGGDTDHVSLVVTLESTFGSLNAVQIDSTGRPKILQSTIRWDPPNLGDRDTGLRLAEEIVRRTRKFLKDYQEIKPDKFGISMPGTLDGTSTVLSSKRLGVFNPIDISKAIEEAGGPDFSVYHDTECMAVGEAQFGDIDNGLGTHNKGSDFCYIFVDEGIGSKLFIDNRPVLGAGSAGHLGRLIVQPEGAYSETFASKGPLEVFSSRPSVSSNMVGLYRAERGKVGGTNNPQDAFRRFLQAASENDWTALTYKQINLGLARRDPIATAVLEDAARYLGLAVNAVITITHPPLIILGGGMITELTGFVDSVVGYARRFSWELAWNRIQIRRSTLGRDSQILGTAALLDGLV